MNTNKKGYITLEHLLIACTVGAFCIMTYMAILPKETGKTIDVANGKLLHVIGSGEGSAGSGMDKVGTGGSGPIITNPNPDSDFVCDAVGLNECSITLYTGTGTSLVIPSMIGSSNVVEIGASAFANKNLTSVVIPSGVKKIGANAFSNNKLSSIDIPYVESLGTEAFAFNEIEYLDTGKLTEIPSRAFMGNKITTVRFGNSLTIIRSNAFANNAIESVSLPVDLITIEREAFYNNKISTLYINESLSTIQPNAFGFQDINNGIVFIQGDYNRFDAVWSNCFDADLRKESRESFGYLKLDDTTCTLTSYSGSERDIVIPSTIDGLFVVDIASNTFANRGLTSVIIPDTVQSIGDSAFENNNLTNLILSSRVRSIGEYAFAGNSLNAIDIRGELSSLGTASFVNQDIVNGTVIMTTNTVNRFNLTDNTSWQKYFDNKLQKGRN